MFGTSLILLLTVNLFSLCCCTVFSQSDCVQQHAFNFQYLVSMMFKQFLSLVHFVSEACQFFSEYCISYWWYKASDILAIFIFEVFLRHHSETAVKEQKTETSQKIRSRKNLRPLLYYRYLLYLDAPNKFTNYVIW